MLDIRQLSVSMDGKKLLDGIDMHVARGARHLLSGHNGSGKSTLAQTIAGNPEYEINAGEIIFDGRNVTGENTTTRALMGIFLGAQNVPEISGLTVMSFLKYSMAAHAHFRNGRDLSMGEFLQTMESVREKLGIPREWLNRSINVGFSGGERKRLMLMRLIMTAPRLAILDEPDSGADAQTQQLIARTIREMPDTTFIIISHQPNFTEMVRPTSQTVLSHGRVVIE